MLGVVIVNYKSIDEIVLYVKQELVKIATPYKIAIVDVSCSEIKYAREIAEKCSGQLIESLDAELDIDKKVYVLPHHENLGYARGNNYGARFLSKQFDIEFFLFSNHDLKFIDNNVVEVLIEEARQHEDMGAIGPRILDLEGKDQSPMNYCNIWKRIIIPYGFFPFIYPFLAFFSDIVPKATFNAYYRLMGCFVIVKADVFMDVGAFDEGTFLYAEEMILSERMKRLGKKMYFNPNVALIHAHGQVIGKSIGRLRAMHLRIKSELYFYRKYIGVSKLEEILSRLTVILFVKCYYPILKLIKNCLIEYRI